VSKCTAGGTARDRQQWIEVVNCCSTSKDGARPRAKLAVSQWGIPCSAWGEWPPYRKWGVGLMMTHKLTLLFMKLSAEMCAFQCILDQLQTTV